MKTEKWSNCAISAVFAFCVTLSSLLCLITAFGLDTVDTATLIWLLIGFAVFTSVCFTLRHGGWIVVAVWLLLSWHLVREGTILLETEAALNHISKVFDRAYRWGVIHWSGTELKSVSTTGIAAVLGAVISTAVSWTVCRKHSAAFAIIAGILPLTLCFVVTDTVPEVKWLFLLLSMFALLLLTQPARCHQAQSAIRLTALLLIPVLLASFLLFYFTPQDSHEVQMDPLRQKFFELIQDIPFLQNFNNGSGGIAGGTDIQAKPDLDLSKVGPKATAKTPVMYVVSPKTETLYLRGQALEIYSGRGWIASELDGVEDIYWPQAGFDSYYTLSIETRKKADMLFFSYYPTGQLWNNVHTSGYLQNKDETKTYTIGYAVAGEYTRIYVGDKQNEIYQQCLTLPEDTYAWAQAYLQENLDLRNSTVAEQALRIADFVQLSASYSLNTERMPSDATDFARWFLEESETGYCIHYATAATVLLRAAGIPARYVSGYTAQVQADVRKTVTADRAHAWVEYLDPVKGWTMLEPTPSEAFETPSETTKPTETTRPTEATRPTETTQPTETTEPTETTKPTETTRPTNPKESTQKTEPTETQPEISGDVPGREANWLPWVLGLGIAVVLSAAVAGQYQLRRKLRRKRMYSGERNQQAIYRWRYVLLLSKVTGMTIPERLQELVEKAKFSQHTLTKEELREFEDWFTAAKAALKEKPLPKRLLLKLVYAIP